MKPKILFRIMVARRDAIYCVLMKELFERMGWDVMLTSIRSFQPTLERWKPDVVVTSSVSNSASYKEISPDSLVVFLDAEGFQAVDGNRSVQFSNNRESFDKTDLILVWGDAEYKPFLDLADKMDVSKVHVFGNPKLDFVRYLPKRLRPKEQPNSVGFVSRFPRVNHHEGISTLRNLWEQHTLDFTVAMAKSYTSFYRAAKAVLEQTDLRVSVRVHPFEDIQAYHKYFVTAFPAEYRDRIEINETLGFTDWAIQQRALVSPSSTSFLEAYLLNIPVYNLDIMSDTDGFNNAYADVVAEWQQAADQPRTYSELCEMLVREQPDVKANEDIELQLRKYCDWDNEKSACLRAVEMIVDAYNKKEKKWTFAWPKSLVSLRDDISFRRTIKKQPLHVNFSYKEGWHETPEFIEEMADMILGQK